MAAHEAQAKAWTTPTHSTKIKMNPTDRTITFSEGSNGLSTHTVFVDDDGVEHIPNRDGWKKISDVQKPVHDPVKFLNDAPKRTGIPTPEPVIAEAVKAINKSADPSKPLYKLDKDGRLHKLREL